MSHMGLYALNPTPKQRYNSYKGEMNGTCKNLLLDKRENKYIRKTYFNRNLKTTSVNQKWTTDVSDFKTAMSKLYLSPILDMHSRKIVGYDISTTPSLFQTYRMLDMAFSKFFHSNQGWQPIQYVAGCRSLFFCGRFYNRSEGIGTERLV